jgi:hypothetical protein
MELACSGVLVESKHQMSYASHNDVINSSKFRKVTMPVNSLRSLFQITEKVSDYSHTIASMH